MLSQSTADIELEFYDGNMNARLQILAAQPYIETCPKIEAVTQVTIDKTKLDTTVTSFFNGCQQLKAEGVIPAPNDSLAVVVDQGYEPVQFKVPGMSLHEPRLRSEVVSPGAEVAIASTRPFAGELLIGGYYGADDHDANFDLDTAAGTVAVDGDVATFVLPSDAPTGKLVLALLVRHFEDDVSCPFAACSASLSEYATLEATIAPQSD